MIQKETEGWIDITQPLRPGIVVWPGDQPFLREPTCSIAAGDDYNTSRLVMSAHTGTHLDAPRHFLPKGRTVDQMPVEAMFGRARVIEILKAPVIRAEHLRPHRLRAGDRVLFKTDNSRRRRKVFAENYVALDHEAAAYLAERRIRLVGIDGPSVSGFHDDHAAIHSLLMKADIWIVEGLSLAKAPAGRCLLHCLPLLLTGSDGAPVRALLCPIKKRGLR